MKKFNLSIIIFILPLLLAAQTNVDSLVNVLETQKLTAEKRFELYDKICNVFLYNDIEKTKVYAEEGLKLAKEEKNKFMMSKFTEFIGLVYVFESNNDSARIYLEQALDWAIESKNKIREASMYVSLAILSHSLNLYDKYLEYNLKAFTLFENEGDEKHCATVLANIGGMYRILGDTVRAIDYLERAIAIAEKTDYSLIKVGAYYELGAVYTEQEKYETALKYGLKTIELCRSINNVSFEVSALLLVATVYNAQGNYEEAEKYSDECFRLAEQVNDFISIYNAWALR
ncbi:MAG: tetratricopeptide repeat protein, partial [Tannerella sp.]|nr:tetratricopeptide repeat protein [Tannerella sp.]